MRLLEAPHILFPLLYLVNHSRPQKTKHPMLLMGHLSWQVVLQMENKNKTKQTLATLSFFRKCTRFLQQQAVFATVVQKTGPYLCASHPLCFCFQLGNRYVVCVEDSGKIHTAAA